MNDVMIDLNGVSKDFKVSDCETIFDYIMLKHFFNKKTIHAIKDVSFKINKGEFVGLLGVNGAGKSTLIKMMTGIMIPTDGKVKVLGNDPFKKRMQNNYRIGAVFGQRCQLRWDIAPIESYRLFQSIYNIPEKEFNERLSYMANMLDMNSFINQPVRTLSLGQKMRAELVGAFLHNPDIVFLDEPTLGLDIISKEAITDFLAELKEKGNTTIIFTTHDMEDVKTLCDRLIVVNKGRVVVDDDIDNLDSYTDVYTVLKMKTMKENIVIPDYIKKYDYTVGEREISIKISDESKIASVLEKMFSSNNIYEVDIAKPEFKEIFKRLFAEEGNIT